MKVFTYTLYKEFCDLYTEINGSIAVNSFQIELARKDIILLSKVSMVIYIRLVNVPAQKTLNSYILTSQRVLIPLMN